MKKSVEMLAVFAFLLMPAVSNAQKLAKSLAANKTATSICTAR